MNGDKKYEHGGVRGRARPPGGEEQESIRCKLYEKVYKRKDINEESEEGQDRGEGAR